MSEDEDEELAMLRLQALMSKRRGGSGPSKELPFPLTLPPFSTSAQPLSTQPVPPESVEAPVTTSPAVVTSAVSALTDALHDVSDTAGTYRQPHFLHGQASYCHDSGYCFSNFLSRRMYRLLHYVSDRVALKVFFEDPFLLGHNFRNAV